MKEVGIRSDFLSDNSSDDDDLPFLSLRERLAKKNQTKTAETIVVVHDDDSVDTPIEMRADGQEMSNRLQLLGTNIHTSATSSSITETTKLSTLQNANTESSSKYDYHPVTVTSAGSEESTTVGCKKKRTREEVEENKRKAQEKKQAREESKKIKDAEKEMRKIEREAKKQVSIGSCLQFITVRVDTNVVNVCGLGTAIFKACDELGAKYRTLELATPFTIMWTRSVTGCNFAENLTVEAVNTDVEEDDVIAIIPVTEFVSLVDTFKQVQQGVLPSGVTLRSYVEHLMSCLPGKMVTVIVPGLEQYFRDQKSKTKKQYRDAVSSTKSGHVSRGDHGKPSVMAAVSRVEVEEACVDMLLHTGTSIHMLDTAEEVADHVRRFTKAVAERPAKKDRFDPVFSFLEEGVGGVKVDRNGGGLLKVWKQQLLQFKNISPDVAQALIAQYPSPSLLIQAYKSCSSEKEAIKLIENITVRRGAGVLETTRRIGKEQSRRIYTFFTSDDPNLVIK